MLATVSAFVLVQHERIYCPLMVGCDGFHGAVAIWVSSVASSGFGAGDSCRQPAIFEKSRDGVAAGFSGAGETSL